MSSAKSPSMDLSAPKDHTKHQRSNEQEHVGSHLFVEEQTSSDSSISAHSTSIQQTVVSFGPQDPANPNNWSSRKKIYVVLVGIVVVLNSTIASSIASGATNEISAYFHIDNQEQLVLPTSIYLVGYVLGPLVFAPMSESYGRRWIMIGTFALYTAFTLGCALAPTFAALVVFRLFVGMGASAPISVVGGIYADIYNNPTTRGRAMTAFMTATMFGPLLGPVSSGFISVVSWRWSFWLCLIIAGVTWPMVLTNPETYGPIILKKRAQRLRRETGNQDIVAPIELRKKGMRELIMVTLARPLRMLFTEAIVFCSCIYLSFAYAIFYMFFEAFPIIFSGIYGFNAGEEGLAFLPIGIGSLLACLIYLYWDHVLLRAKTRCPPAPWTQKEEYRRLPLACLGGPFFVLSLFWMGWTASPAFHWIVPVLSALPFGIGFLLVFQGLLNYLVDAYEIYAASAAAAAATSRSLFGAVLPFAARPMYDALGIAWACSTLGFLSALMCGIPFVFIWFGDEIREGSRFCRELKKRKIEEERERESEKKEHVRVPPEKMV